MRYIQKDQEPEEFTRWKQAQKSIGVNCDYGSLQNPEKRLVHYSLLREQGYICCYCCMQIERDSSHIEHLNPQSQTTDTDLSVDYANMLASCGRSKPLPDHCGNKRGNLPIMVSPLQANCEEFFGYSGDGEILATENPEKQEAAATTIDTLGLNDYDLRIMRIEAIDLLEGLTADEAKQFAEYYDQRDEQGRYQPFCTAVLYFLQHYFGA